MVLNKEAVSCVLNIVFSKDAWELLPSAILYPGYFFHFLSPASIRIGKVFSLGGMGQEYL